MRCIALSEMLRSSFDITFFIKEVPEELKKQMIAGGAYIRQITDETEFFNELDQGKIIVLDGYQFTTEFQKRIKATGAQLVCIDDMTDIHYVADAVINYGPCVKSNEISHSDATKLYLGLDYVLLREVFREQIGKKIITRSRTNNKTAFVCFGGSDSLNLTGQTIHLLVAHGVSRINVVVGAAFEHDLSWLANAKYSGVRLLRSIDATTMLSVMLASDFAIVPASSVLLELFSVGIPVITGYWTQNQERGAKDFGKIGMALYCGNFLENYEQRLSDLLAEINDNSMEEMCVKQKKAIANTEFNYLTIFKQLNKGVL
jgi:spore coat polysaccharide biosynthesis predicted glycosyltransferase SpsG